MASQLWSPNTSFLLIVGERESIWMQKVEFIIFFHFSHCTWMKSQHFHAIFPNSAANMQQSTVKEGGNIY